MSGVNGLKDNRYLAVSKRRFDTLTAFLGIGLLIAVLLNTLGPDVGLGIGSEDVLLFNDFRSFFFVVGGTMGILLFQFDVETFLHTLALVVRSFFANPVKRLGPLLEELDEAIIRSGGVLDLREGKEITGELLNDIVYMVRQKLFYEEIEDFVSSRVATLFLARKSAVALLGKGAKIAPSLGLLGTVIGLIEVLQALEDPESIGAAMSLALMTTAFGCLLGSLVFTPLAGRLEHHNNLYVETHKLVMNRVSVLIRRQERLLDATKMNRKVDAGQ